MVSGNSKEKNVTISFEILSKLLNEAKGKNSIDLVKQLGTRVNNDAKVVKPKNHQMPTLQHLEGRFRETKHGLSQGQRLDMFSLV